MKILVFGGSGFLGSHTCIKLIEDGYQLDVVTRSALSKNSLLNPFVERIQIIDWSDWPQLAFEKYDCVVVMIGGTSAKLKESEIEETNFTIPSNIFKKTVQSGVKHFVFISSLASRSGHSGRYNEESEYLPRSTPYGQAKMKIEKYLLEQKTSTAVTILSPGFMIGEGDIHITSSTVFLQLRMGRIKSYPNGNKTICHPSDVAEAIVVSVTNKTAGLFLLGGFLITYEEFFETATKEMGLPFNLKQDPSWQSQTPFENEFFDFSQVDDSKARRELGFNPKISPKKMIERAVKSLKENRRI